MPTSKNHNIIIGIDPGYDRLGIAVIEKQNPKDQLLFSDCIQTSSTLPFSERLTIIGNSLKDLVAKYEPGLVAMEKVFVTNNQKTAMMVGEVRGALMYVLGCQNIPLVEYTPSEIKLTVTGNGSADKHQIMAMVKHLIIVNKPIKLDDEFDAIAIAITASAKEQF